VNETSSKQQHQQAALFHRMAEHFVYMMMNVPLDFKDDYFAVRNFSVIIN
jgi:hypothetical protein